MLSATTVTPLGIISAAGSTKVAALIDVVRDETDARLPDAARFAVKPARAAWRPRAQIDPEHARR